MQKHQVAFATLAALAACAYDAPQSVEPVQLSEREQAIYNGSRDFSSLPDSAHSRQSVVQIHNFGNDGGQKLRADCTGQLLREDVVLTARHCVVTVPGEDDGPVAPASHLFVMREAAATRDPGTPPACDDTDCARVTEISTIGQDTDVALLFLAKRLQTDGSFANHFFAISPYARPVEDSTLACLGMGVRTTAEESSEIGILRWGWSDVTSASNSSYEIGPGSVNHLPMSGDSGGTCLDRRTYPASGQGILSYGWWDRDNVPTIDKYVSAYVYGKWARREIFEHQSDVYESFTTPTDPIFHALMAMRWQFVTPDDAVGTPSWTFTNNVLSEASNAYASTGILAVHSEVVDNGFVSVKVKSPDDDEAGVVFRYVDPQNYYAFVVNEAKKTARFIKVRNGSVQVLDTNTVTVDWNSWTEVGVYLTDYWFVGRVGDTNVLQMQDKTFPLGRMGIYKSALANASFDNFKLDRAEPWWAAW